MNGRVFIALAVAEGLAGPAQSLMAMNSLYMTILTVFIDGQDLSSLQAAALATGLTGSAIISVGDKLYSKIKG